MVNVEQNHPLKMVMLEWPVVIPWGLSECRSREKVGKREESTSASSEDLL